MKRNLLKGIGLLLAVLMVMSIAPLSLLANEGAAEPIHYDYGDYSFTKISNPTSGSAKPDGINTNDITGFDANRLNSYAWAVASRGDYIYIGTNRTLFGSALNAVTESLSRQNPNLDASVIKKVATLISGGEVPVDLEDEDYIPQIIKFDVKSGYTEVIYQPQTAIGEDGRFYYTDMDGNILLNADVASETASFRSVVEFNGNLYFGSLGVNMLQLVRVDEEDNAQVVFQTIGLTSSLRACCVYDDGTGETVYFGGQDTTDPKWMAYRKDHPGVLPIVIRYLDPATAGTDNEDWSGVIADYEDFGKYAYATVYSSGGGNVWDLCSFGGKMYLILAYDGGWAMFRGERGGANPNKYGWTWTEIVGDDSIYNYPLAMDENVAGLNAQYAEKYGCAEYTPAVKGTGLLESTATPYVYNGKMYIGSFDNATTLQSQTVTKIIVKLQCLATAKETGNYGPTLSQIFAPFYEVLTHPQHVWVMDENENITPVESANALLEGTTIDYVWRFIEHEGKLYTGTFDSATAYNYFLDYPVSRIIHLLETYGITIPDELKSLIDGSYLDQLCEYLSSNEAINAFKEEKGEQFRQAAVAACTAAQDFVNGHTTIQKLIDNIRQLDLKRQTLQAQITEAVKASAAYGKAVEMVDTLLGYFDIEGLQFWAESRTLIKNEKTGFDLFVSADGENFERVVDDGLCDPFNYGARTFTVCDNQLYVGTANPYYGAQLWRITNDTVEKDCPSKDFIDFDPNAWYHKAVDYVVANGLMAGVGGNRFDPSGATTRAMIVNILYNLEGRPEIAAGNKFSDVKSGQWYTDAVIWASENGIVSGYGSGKFGPTDKITREQFALIMMNYAAFKGRSTENRADLSGFADAAKVSKWAQDAMQWANAEGLMVGANNMLSPKNNASRAEAAAILMNYSQLA